MVPSVVEPNETQNTTELDGPTLVRAQTDVESLRHELERLAKLRSRLGFKTEQFPGLTSLAGGNQGLDGVTGLIETRSALLDERERHAAEVLFADSDERWRANLRERMSQAARIVGVGSYNTFRDRSVTGRSQYDELLARLAASLLDSRDSGGRPRDKSNQDEDPGGAPRGLSVRVLNWLLVSVFIGLAAVGTLALSVVANGSDDSERRAGDEEQSDTLPGDTASAEPQTGTDLGLVHVEGCDIPLAGAMNPTATPAGLGELMLDAFEGTGGRASVGCPGHSVEQWGHLWLQEFAGTDTVPTGWVVANPNGEVALWAEASLISSYRHTAGGDLQALGGLPVSAQEIQGRPALQLSNGGAIVAHHPGGPAFWIPAEGVEAWMAWGGPNGELGMPMTDVNYIDGRPHQDYERGALRQALDGDVEVTIAGQVAVDEHLDALERRHTGILRTFDGTAWWVDAQGLRHWIPDGGVWNCLGGDEIVLALEIPGWVIGPFEPGDTMSCP